MTDCVARTGDDKTMWLVTLPEIITNNSTRQEENLVVILSREQSWGPISEHFPDGLYRVSCIMTLYLADTEQTKTQTFTAIYWPQHKALHLFTDEFRLERRLQGHGLGSWITQQFVLWARGLPPETRVLPIEISQVDEKKEENKIRRDRLWHAMGFRFPAGETSSMPLRADELQLPRGRYSTLRVEPLASGVRRLENCYRGLQEKIVQIEGKKLSQKQLIASLKNRPFFHLWHRKGGPLPDEKCDALPLRAEKLSLPQIGDSDLEVEQRATGVIRLATLCAQSQKIILELERDLASQSEVLVGLQTNRLSNLLEKCYNLAVFWGGVGAFLYFIYWLMGS
ncbi:hypothetical protein MKK01_26505 (plasmid) [Klebsiella variicola subsp. variicola]|uniref:hypothetical protein n=1 Tax=Klebsiella variicola TaxID=244366 RepID=UPI001F068ABC|nr:hypothetical protein [Klebsiella variicola]UML91823.1 hypothetical protein MKK01_26505 [Klebsiella variicola subsp. variicola]